MWDKREKVVAVFVFTALYCKVAVVTAKQMDMAPDAVDDQYTQCRDKVLEKVVKTGLLEKELSHSEEFKKVWDANTQCSKLIPGGVKEHTAALSTFANGGNVIKTFNNAVETLGGNASVYHSDFHFKSLHFLLMDSMKLLNAGKCQTVYGIFTNTAQNGSEVRFGRFISVQPEYMDLIEQLSVDKGILFNITSCSVLNLEKNTCNQGLEFEQFISPAEVFTVEEIKHIKDEDYEYTMITLKHSKLHSYHDCYLFSRSSPGSSTQWLGSILLVLMALSPFLFTC